MTRPRDNQRSRLYKAEDHPSIPKGQAFKTVKEMQNYVDALLGSQWFKARWGKHAIEVRDGRGRQSACAWFNVVKMPCYFRNEKVLLHEVAHTLTPHRFAAHGPEFARTYLTLVQHCIGPATGAALKASFRGSQVKVANTAQTMHSLASLLP